MLSETREVVTGGIFVINLYVEPGLNNVTGVDVTLRYDPQDMVVEGLELGGLLGEGALIGVESIASEEGLVQFAAARVGSTEGHTSPDAFLLIEATAQRPLSAVVESLAIERVLLTNDSFEFIPDVRVPD